MSPDSRSARGPAAQPECAANPDNAARQAARAAGRDRNLAMIRTVTAAAGLTSVLAAGAVAYTLPGSAHSATSPASSSALKSTSAPSASSGPGAVTSGGS